MTHLGTQLIFQMKQLSLVHRMMILQLRTKDQSIFSKKPIGGWVSATEDAKVAASAPLHSSRLGHCVAIDSNVVVSGTIGYDIGRGAVYVFVKDSLGWETTTESVIIEATDNAQHDNFGHSVDIEGNIIVIGCPLQDSDQNDTGSIYVVETDNGQWDGKLGTIQLVGYNQAQDSNLGHDVAIEGNMILGGSIKSFGALPNGTNGYPGKILIFRRK